MDEPGNFGRTIQLFFVDGSPTGLIIASIHGWTGSVLIATTSTFSQLLARPETDRTGIYILFGPDPDKRLTTRAYVGEADSVRTRIAQSAEKRGFWETAVVITTSDEALTKGHVRYLEARLIDLARSTGRVNLDNTQLPSPSDRHLPEADRANMEAFLANLKLIFPVIGLELLKPVPTIPHPSGETGGIGKGPVFTLTHKGAVLARAEEQDGEFVVLADSISRRNTDSFNSYAMLKQDLVETGVLVDDGNDRYKFAQPYGFRSPSAAACVVLDRNANGRTAWKVEATNTTYHDWQEQKASTLRSEPVEH